MVAKPEMVVSGFPLCVYIEWENDYQNLNSRLNGIILNGAVPIETVLEINEMLLELEETAMDVLNDRR